MSDEAENDFTFVDRRRVDESAEETDTEGPGVTPGESSPAGPTDGTAGSASASAERDTATSSPFKLPHLSATDRILMCINWLHEGAWIALGLVQDPATEKIEQDLEGARAAIDCIAHLVGKVETKVDEATSRELKNLVRDLQLNFVQQQSRATQ
jgi:hypothetical protein